MQQMHSEYQEKKSKGSRIVSASSKNRQDYYEKYQLDETVQS